MGIAWKHERFARVYFETGDEKAALRATGSKANNASLRKMANKFLHDPKTQAELTKLRAMADEKATQSAAETKSEVNALISEAIGLARRGAPMLDKQGRVIELENGSLARKPDINGMLKGAELKGKTIAMFTDRQQLVSEMEDMSADELRTFMLTALLSNNLLLEEFCQEEVVIRKVHELERRDAASGEGGEGDSAKTADSVSAAPEAAGTPTRRVH